MAYSGGVDSALVLAVATQELGEKALGVIGISPSLDPGDLAQARATARLLGARVRELSTDEFADERYAANPANRCYFCKAELHTKLTGLAKAEGYAVLLDGFQLDDLEEARPGRQAGLERGVRSPLAESGFRKDSVRLLARSLGIPVWDKPAAPCLSSRVVFGTRVTPEVVRRIGEAERLVRAALPGVRVLRVRQLGGTAARIEVDAERVIDLKRQLAALTPRLLALGFASVAAAPEGYRRGGANAPVPVTA